jgi:branched-chain amino acid aminotransferase
VSGAALLALLLINTNNWMPPAVAGGIYICSMGKIVFNGHFIDEETPLFTAANGGFRYGDGLFETMKWLRGEVLHFPLHFQRLQKGLELLQIEASSISAQTIAANINELCRLNGCNERARVRLALYRQQDGTAGYVLEAAEIGPDVFQWQEQGWTLSLYTQNCKARSPLSNVKSANYLLYLLAATHAQQQGVDECVVLNDAGNLCDGSRTNIFVVKNGLLQTPALHQGCVAGVMRRFLLNRCAELKMPVSESVLTETDLVQADEAFLTNAIQGIRWVRSYNNKQFDNSFSKKLFEQTLATIYH